MNKNAIYQLSYGVYVISTWDNGRATGCTANSAMQITSNPATIAVSINHDNYTNKCIASTSNNFNRNVHWINIIQINVNKIHLIISEFLFVDFLYKKIKI